jgi:lysophospholipase L1-like esterase
MVNVMNGLHGMSRANLLSYLDLAYLIVAACLLLLALLTLTGSILVRRRAGRLRSVLARGALVATTSIAGVIVAEVAAEFYGSWVHREPRLAMIDGPPAVTSGSGDVSILVIGESSAEGVPYRDWISVGRIVVWQLRRLFPQRMFHLEVQARAGWTLEQMHQKLAESRRRPDAVIIYAGHNEFASRYPWSGEVRYYADDPLPCLPVRLMETCAAFSPVCRLIREARDRALISLPPAARTCQVVDVPSHTTAQRDERLRDFRRRLGAILGDLEQAGVLSIVIVPPGNDAGFEPNRSVLPPETPRLERDAFAAAVAEARAMETANRWGSIARYRALIGHQPEFAEIHFRLARLLEREGAWEQAYGEYVRARDFDSHPLRCPSAFQDACRTLAERHGAIVVDGQAILHARHPHGLLGDDLFNDGMHPSFEGHVALGEAVLAGLKEKAAFGWPQALPVPIVDLAECARRFDVTTATWKEVCRFAIGFYRTTSAIRFDPAERMEKVDRYHAELRRLEAGASSESGNCPGIGIRPVPAGPD